MKMENIRYKIIKNKSWINQLDILIKNIVWVLIRVNKFNIYSHLIC